MNVRQTSASLLMLAAVAAPVAGCGSSSSSGSKSSSNAAKAGGSSSSSSGGGGGSVSIANFAFKPASLTVKAGAKVAVANKDTTAHTFTADDGHSFDTGNVDPNQSASVTVSKPGTYKYHCSIHPFMHGTLVVK